MNELMISLKSGGGWLYFKTKETNAETAFYEWSKACYENGMNIDNIAVNFIELRDEKGNAIDAKTF